MGFHLEMKGRDKFFLPNLPSATFCRSVSGAVFESHNAIELNEYVLPALLSCGFVRIPSMDAALEEFVGAVAGDANLQQVAGQVLGHNARPRLPGLAAADRESFVHVGDAHFLLASAIDAPLDLGHGATVRRL